MPPKSKTQPKPVSKTKTAKTPSTVVVNLPPDADRLLAENGIDLVAALKESGLAVRRVPVPKDAPKPEGTKEVLLALAGIGVTVSLVASGISKVLDALGRNKKYLVSQRKLMPVLDGKGKPVCDAKGQPLTYWATEKQLLEAKQTTEGRGKMSLEVRPTLLKFSSASGK